VLLCTSGSVAEQVETKHKEEIISDNVITVKILEEADELLGFYVAVEEAAADKVYKYDCVWRNAPEHEPLKIFEEFRSDVDKALVRPTHIYDLWHPELYLVVVDEKGYERAEKLVRPLMKGAFVKIRDKLIILSVKDVVSLHKIHTKIEDRGPPK